MKILMLFLAASLSFAGATFSQSKSELKTSKAEIKTCIENFVKGGDARNIELLESTMESNFRAVVNSPESEALQLLDRATYFVLIKGEKIGGSSRKLEIEEIDIYNNVNASAKVRLVGAKATFYNYYSLVRVNGKWMLVQDLLQMKVNS